MTPRPPGVTSGMLVILFCIMLLWVLMWGAVGRW